MECDSQQQQQQQQQQATKNTEEAKFDTQIKQDVYHSDQQQPHHHQPHQQGGDRSDLGPVEKRMKASDFAEYDELINELADQLKLARHPDSLVVLKAARLLLEANNNTLTPAPSSAVVSLMVDGDNSNRAAQLPQSQENDTETRASGCLNKDGSSRLGDDRIRTIQQSKFTLNDVLLPKTLVTKTSDSEKDVNKKYDLTSAFERAAKALKLLYLDDQRQLQNQVNELISSIQSITANPRTDPRLLATGR
uniref:UPF0568 protein n=1 Tax=Aceria tosichella TaxID=561515 RepID=A0A6G1SCM3_9ACAR